MKLRPFLLLTLVVAIFSVDIPTAKAEFERRRLVDSVSPQKIMEESVDTMYKSMLVNAKEIEETCPNEKPAYFTYVQNLINDIGSKHGASAALDILDIVNGDLAFYVRFFMYTEGYAGDNTDVLGFTPVKREMSNAIKDSHMALDGFFGSVELLFSHGRDLDNYEVLWQAIMFAREYLSEEEAKVHAEKVQKVIETTVGYDHPILSLNAVAISPAYFDEESEGIIIIGEGMHDFFQSQTVQKLSSLTGLLNSHAHEFGHIRQFNLGLYNPLTDTKTTNTTRKFELMADAFASFYLRHPSGGKMSLESISDVYEFTFGLGDCHIEKDGHHGTPAQRQCAAIWGANQALRYPQDARITGRKLEIEFAEKFVEVLEGILQLDSDLCPSPEKEDPDQPELNSLTKTELRAKKKEERQKEKADKRAARLGKRKNNKN